MSAGRPLPFVEAFGPTLQGEGPAMGRLADFVRFGGCNLSCSWCDSAFTWDASRHNLREQITMLDTQAVMDATPNTAPLLIITGGEPMLNQNNPAFIEYVQQQWFIRHAMHVETNGTIAPNYDIGGDIDLFIVSPKLAHAGLHKRTQSTAVAPGWREFIDDGKVRLKVVVQTAEDVAAAVDLADRLGMDRDHVWVMPEGTTPAVLAERWPTTANAAIAHGINASHRLHVLAWNDERGH